MLRQKVFFIIKIYYKVLKIQDSRIFVIVRHNLNYNAFEQATWKSYFVCKNCNNNKIIDLVSF